MIKRSKWVYIVGSIIIGIVSVLFIFSGLIFSGVIDASSRKLVFSSAGTYKTYDGTELVLDEWELSDGKLKEGHKAQVKVLGKQLDVGKSDNEFSVVILDNNGADVSSDYKIEKRAGVLEVKPFELTVSADDVERVYNGKPLTGEDADGIGYALDKDLPENHEIKVEFVGAQTNVGTKENVPSVSIFHDERDVTGNFNVQALNGTLTVKPVDLLIKSFDAKKDYDGTPCVCPDGENEYEILAGELVGNDEVDIVLLNRPTNAGKYDNEFSVTFVRGEKNNYKIEYQFGKLEINKFKVTLATESDEWTYDGKLHALKKFEIFPKELPKGKLVVDESTFKSVKNVKDSTDNTVYYQFDGVSGDNYELTLDFGKIVIKPLPVVVETSDLSWTYDGKAHGLEKNSENEKHVSFQCASPVDGETFTWNEDITARVTYVADKDVKNSVAYSVVNGDMGNYDFKEKFGLLTIKPRSISVVVKGEVYTYDGKAHPTAEERSAIKATCTNLEETELVFHYNLLDFASIVNVAQSGVEMPADWYITYNNARVDIENFDVKEEFGKLGIERRVVKFRTPDGEKAYDGEPLTTEDTAFLEEGTLVSGHRLTLNCIGEVTFVMGEAVENSYKNVDILDEGNQSVLDNYNWTIACGELWIVPRAIRICASDYTGVYDGMAHYVDDPVCEGLPTYAEHEISWDYEPFAVWRVSDSSTYSWENKAEDGEFSWYVVRNVYDEYGILIESTPVSEDNFEVSFVSGNIQITPYVLRVTTKNYETYYNGNWQTPDSTYYGDYYLLDENDYAFLDVLGHSFEPVFVEQKEIGVHSTDIATDNYFVYDYYADEDVTENYSFHCVEKGVFHIKKIPLYVWTGDSTDADDQTEFVYNGLPKSYEKESGYDSGAVLAGHYFEFLSFATAIDCVVDGLGNYVGVENVATYQITDDMGDNVEEYYEVIEKFGRLVVLPVEFNLETKGLTKPYENKAWSYEYLTENTMIEVGDLEARFGVEFEWSNWAVALNVQEGGVQNSCVYKVTKGGKDVSYNFKGIENFGTLVVTPKEITITTPSEARQYNGETWVGGVVDFGEEAVEFGLLSGHKLEYKLFIPDIKTVGKYNYTAINVQVLSEETGEEVTNNYKVVCASYREITPRKITVYSESKNFVYDGTEHTHEVAFTGFYTLLDGHSYQAHIVFTGSQTEIGSSKNTFIIEDIVDKNGVSVRDYYEVTLVFGDLTVTA